MEVPAGSYECFQIEAKQTVKAGILNREYQVKDFFSEGIGQVRSEIYNKKGKLESYTVSGIVRLALRIIPGLHA